MKVECKAMAHSITRQSQGPAIAADGAMNHE